MRFLVASALCAVVFASPASAASFTFCGTYVKDLRGKDRIQIWSPVIDADTIPEYKSRWESYIMPHVENAVRGQSEVGRRGTQCLNPRSDRVDVSKLRNTMMSIARRNGILVSEAPFDVTATAEAKGNGSESAAAEERAEKSSEGSEGRNQASADEGNGKDSSNSRPADGEKEKPRFLRRVAITPPPAGYGDWQQIRFNGFDYLVKVFYAQKASKDEVRVLWRCVNESNVDVSCSIGAGKDKTYICEKPGHYLGTTRSLGERATVRSGSSYTFPSDWACRGTGAVSVSSNPDVAVEPL